MLHLALKQMRCALGILVFSAPPPISGYAQAETKEQVGAAPVVTLKVWNASSELEQNSFLAGFVSLVELEKEWQAQKGILPLSQSMVGSWANAMDGMSINSLRSTVNRYAENNPRQAGKLVLEVLWVTLVQPKIQATSPTAAKETPKRIRKIMKSQATEKNL